MPERGAIDLLREAAEIMRDPSGRDPRDVDAVATRLEVIAARAAETGVSRLLAVEATQVPADSYATGVHESLPEWHARINRQTAALCARESARKRLAEFLRASSFDVEALPQPDRVGDTDREEQR